MQAKPIVSFVGKYAENIGIGVRNWTKPTNLNALHFSPTLACDTVQLNHISPLQESFVKSLLQLKGKDSTETLNLIKNSILKRMGYNNPELLNLKIDPVGVELMEKLGMIGEYSCGAGKMMFSKKIADLPIENQIAMIYHELDHMDKYVKLYKSVGEKRFLELAVKQTKNSPLYEPMIKNGFNMNVEVNNDFYKKMGENICLDGFDVNYWSRAMSEYAGMTPRYCDQYKYFNNPLENSAYNIQSKVQKILGLPSETSRDRFPKNYVSMINSLKKQKITDEKERENIVYTAMEICKLKNANNRLFELLLKGIKGVGLTPEETKYFDLALSDINSGLLADVSKSVKLCQQSSIDAETLISKGLFTIDDITGYFANL